MTKMSEEKKIILRMLKEGKISEEEAIKLLDSISDDKKIDKDNLKSEASDFVEKIYNAALKFGEKSQEVIGSINFDDFSLDDLNLNFKGSKNAEAERVVTESVEEIENPKLKIKNDNGKIRLYAWDNEEVEVRATVVYDDKYISSNYSFVTMEKDGDTIEIAPDYDRANSRHFNMNMAIAIPKKKFESIVLETQNSNISIGEILTKDLEIKSTNARISFVNVNADDAKFESFNGRISGEGISGKTLILKTTNGKITVKNLDTENVEMKTVNGSLSLDGIKENVKKVDAKTNNGNVNVSIKEVFKPIKAKITNYVKEAEISNFDDNLFTNFVTEDGSMIAFTDDYKEEGDSLDITASTYMGSINIK